MSSKKDNNYKTKNRYNYDLIIKDYHKYISRGYDLNDDLLFKQLFKCSDYCMMKVYCKLCKSENEFEENGTEAAEEDEEGEDLMCSICLSGPGELTNLTELSKNSLMQTSCNHNMCVSCFIGLFRNNSTKITCPVCRSELFENNSNNLNQLNTGFSDISLNTNNFSFTALEFLEMFVHSI